MAEQPYAYVQEGNVVNVVIFDNPSEETLSYFKELNDLDDIILSGSNTCVGGTWDGTRFWTPKPFNSFIKNEELGVWEAPVARPDSGFWEWDEATVSWVEIVNE
jgi:hypothetical protein